MKSLLHCFWTGSSFPYGLRTFIKTWITYLRKSNSEFQLIVWLTPDSYTATSDYLAKGLGNRIESDVWNKCFPGIDIEFSKA